MKKKLKKKLNKRLPAVCQKQARGSFTVEASVIMILIVTVLALIISTSLQQMQQIGAEAMEYAAAEERRYEEGVQPVHLIRLGQLWDNRPGGRGKEENGFTQ